MRNPIAINYGSGEQRSPVPLVVPISEETPCRLSQNPILDPRFLNNRFAMNNTPMNENTAMPPLWRQLTWWVLLFPAAMLMAAMFFTSIYFTFRDSFESSEGDAP